MKDSAAKAEEMTSTPIAIVGIETLYPGSLDNADFWRHIVTGTDLIQEVPPTHWLIEDYYDPDPSKPGKIYARRGAFVPFVDFDPIQFGIPPKVLSATDTVQLLSLLVAKRLVESTLCLREQKVCSDKVGVILGCAGATEMTAHMSGQLQKPHWVKAMREAGLPEGQVEEISQRIIATYPEWTEATFPGLLTNVIAGRIANRLDFKGTNCIVDVACASSLAAMHLAICELQLHTADLVITGGVDAVNDVLMHECFCKTGALSSTSDCRPFSENADGTVLGEGFGLFAFRRLADAERDGDQIYAVVRSIGSSSDGKGLSVYAPLAKGQAIALERAYELAKIEPSEVELIEAHATATPVGDLAEFEGLTQVFNVLNPNQKQWCALGSIKAQLGHTKGAAGATSLYKAAMALHHKVLPGTPKIGQPSSKLNLEESAFYLNGESRPWIHSPTSTRKAGVSSFGFGGSNFHLIVEEYKGSKKPKRCSISPVELLLFSADSLEGLKEEADRWLTKLEDLSLAEIAYETQKNFHCLKKQRLSLLVPNDGTHAAARVESAFARLQNPPGTPRLSMPYEMHYDATPPAPKLAYLFPGQGSQYLYMGKDLAMQFEENRFVWDQSVEVELDPQTPLFRVVCPPYTFSSHERHSQEERLKDTEWAQPAIGLVSLSQLALLQKMGLKPSAVAGHSYGELTALYASGVIGTWQDFLRISRRRGELMAQVNSMPGAMSVVFTSLDEMQKLLQSWDLPLTIANINSPTQLVLSGESQRIAEAERRLEKLDIRTQRLEVSTAFHSDWVKESLLPFAQFLDPYPFHSPQVPVYANTTATLYPSNVSEIKELLASQLAYPVQFQSLVEQMYADGVRVFLEVGPGHALSGLVRSCLEEKYGDFYAISLDERNSNGIASFWNAVGSLAAAGAPLQLEPLWENFAFKPSSHEKPKLSSAAVKLNGTNYGKKYPPKGGARGRPKPNSEAPQDPTLPSQALPIATLSQQAVPLMDQEEPFPTPEREPALPSVESQQQPHGMAGETWLKAFQDLHATALAAQQHFEQTLYDSHKVFLRLTETALREISHLSGMDPGTRHAESGSAIHEHAPTADAQTPAPSTPSAPTSAPRPQVLPPAAVPATAAPAKAAEAAPPKSTAVRAPVAAFPPPPEAAELPATAKKMAPPPGFAAATAPSPSGQPPTPPQPRPSAPPTASHQSSAPASSRLEAGLFERLQELLFTVVAEKTGYPKEILELDMELEGGLGVDSIKRVEILAALQQKIPELEKQDRNKLAQLRTLREIIEFGRSAIGEETEKKNSPSI